VDRAIKKAEQDQAEAVILLINTPGGLVSATLDVLQSMSSSTFLL